jgi:polysaccharide pyruvyl transferase WcaK-like protein
MTEKHDRIALLHHTGGGNLGDDATIDVVIANIRQRRPHVEIAIFSMNPLDTAERHGVPSEPIRRHTWHIGYGAGSAQPPAAGAHRLKRWIRNTRNPIIRGLRALLSEAVFLFASFRKLSRFGQLVISGGGQLTERSGPWGFPYAIFVWTLMAKIAGLRCIFLSVGAGPLKHPLSRFLVARSLDAASYVSFRDVQSQVLAREVGFRGDSRVFPDNTYSMHWKPIASPEPGSRSIIGLAPMPFPFCDPREYASGHQEIYDEYIRKFAVFAASLAQEHCLEMFGSDAGADASAIEDLRRVLNEQHGVLVPPSGPSGTVDELLSRMSKMDYIVTCRFHGIVMAHILNKPVLAIAHHPKITHLMQAIGLGDFCVDIRTFDPLHLSNSFVTLVRDREIVRQRMARTLDEYRADVARQFDLLFTPAEAIAGHSQVGHHEAAMVSGRVAGSVSKWSAEKPV